MGSISVSWFVDISWLQNVINTPGVGFFFYDWIQIGKQKTHVFVSNTGPELIYYVTTYLFLGFWRKKTPKCVKKKVEIWIISQWSRERRHSKRHHLNRGRSTLWCGYEQDDCNMIGAYLTYGHITATEVVEFWIVWGEEGRRHANGRSNTQLMARTLHICYGQDYRGTRVRLMQQPTMNGRTRNSGGWM